LLLTIEESVDNGMFGNRPLVDMAPIEKVLYAMRVWDVHPHFHRLIESLTARE